MKTLKLIAVGVLLFASNAIHAQVAVNLNVGTPPPQPPVWGPVVTTEEYYYLPDIGTYYDIREAKYIYRNNGTWVRSTTLPARYRTYDLRTGNVVVINDYHGRKPYVNYKVHKVKYYKANNNWEKAHHDNGKHKGKGKGKRK